MSDSSIMMLLAINESLTNNDGRIPEEAQNAYGIAETLRQKYGADRVWFDRENGGVSIFARWGDWGVKARGSIFDLRNSAWCSAKVDQMVAEYRQWKEREGQG
jgi:hypothetical protein